MTRTADEDVPFHPQPSAVEGREATGPAWETPPSNMGDSGCRLSGQGSRDMVEIDVTCHIEAFRRFLINSTCRSFIPESYLRDPEVFPEKESEPGSIYIEAVDKVTLKTIRDISFVNANEVLGIIYTSKSGHSKLKWRQLRGPMGRVSGEASNNSLVNLSMARVITPEYVEELLSQSREGVPAEGGHEEIPTEEIREEGFPGPSEESTQPAAEQAEAGEEEGSEPEAPRISEKEDV